MLIRLKNGIEKDSDAKLIERASYIRLKMTDNPNFPSPTPNMADLAAATEAFETAVLNAGSGDRILIAEKNAKRTALINTIHLLGYYVVFAAHGDSVKVQTSGFELAKQPSPAPELQKPTDLKVENSGQSGVLLVSVKTVKGAKAYMHQYSTDPLLKEESWMSMNCTQTKCRLEMLKPGTTYYVRVGAIGTRDQVMYSDVVSRIAA